MDVAEYTPQELARLQLGWIVRERPGDSPGSPAGGSGQRREIQRGQEQARQEMLQDLGFD